jgi:hypothetical protein
LTLTLVALALGTDQPLLELGDLLVELIDELAIGVASTDGFEQRLAMRLAVEHVELRGDQVDIDHSITMLGSGTHLHDDGYASPIEASTNNTQLWSLTLHFRCASEQLREQLAVDSHAN